MELGFLQTVGILVVAVSLLGLACALAWIDATPRNNGRSLD
jgi:hypothetical protein